MSTITGPRSTPDKRPCRSVRADQRCRVPDRGEQVEAAISARVASTYRAGGSVAFASLPELTGANLGKVVNVTDAPDRQND